MSNVKLIDTNGTTVACTNVPDDFTTSQLSQLSGYAAMIADAFGHAGALVEVEVRA
ncbi:hypothetical protein [Microbacterium sp.]|uniref:hypothetical protein n=1 Tax=Microbacterium sp. TaxID=51671 RepID=UPI003F9A728D